ncbi:hypothetical protein SAMN04487818_10971 [Actinokineospora terrae]|uniref:Pentapeptide repeat-containing protein n=1 Tax=Actinokineospora terrae TaxID=155974 RepID=A0A1H9VTV6_9PSEU|nr:hypothetical protein SAMN04487818_10971 [Actinokineospora terrae]
MQESFAGLDVDHFDAMSARFDRCAFDNTRIRRACFGSGIEVTEYVDCSFDGAHISAPSPGVARFERCTFRGSRLVKWLCDSVEFIDCVFTGRISEVNFTAAVPPMDARLIGRTTNRFERNDFSAATLAHVAFRDGIDLLDQRLPTTGSYLVEDGDVVIPKMLALARAWPESRAKDAVVAHLETKSLYRGVRQRHVLFTAASWEGKAFAGLDGYERLVDLARLAGA